MKGGTFLTLKMNTHLCQLRITCNQKWEGRIVLITINIPLANADFLLNWAANKIRPLCNLTWSARVVTYWWKFTEDILLRKIKLRFLYYTPVEAFRMVSLILLLLPLAFAADLPNIVIVLTDDQVTLKIMPWYKVGFWYWYCAGCLAKNARHFAFCNLNSTFLFCILLFAFCIFHFVFSILDFAFYFLYFPFCVLHFVFFRMFSWTVWCRCKRRRGWLESREPLLRCQRQFDQINLQMEDISSLIAYFFKTKLIVSSVSKGFKGLLLVLGKQGQQPNWTTKKSISYAYFRMHLWTRPSVAHPGISSMWQ